MGGRRKAARGAPADRLRDPAPGRLRCRRPLSLDPSSDPRDVPAAQDLLARQAGARAPIPVPWGIYPLQASRRFAAATRGRVARRGVTEPALAFLRYLGSQIGVLFLWLIHFLPLAWISAMGAGLGAVLYRFGRGRVTQVNLALCFPQMTEPLRK